MNRLFRRSDTPRRNSDDEHKKMQFWTPRGTIPSKSVDQDVAKVNDAQPVPRRNRRFYPKEFENQEAIFQPHEMRDAENRKFSEIPVNTRMDLTRPAATAQQVINRDQRDEPNDRARKAQNPLNDPGPFRGIVTVNNHTGQKYGVTGVTYHPEGDHQGVARARVEPLDREGRKALHRAEDEMNRMVRREDEERRRRREGGGRIEEGEGANTRRTGTWPPRDQDADDLTTYENRYQQERRPRNAPPVPRVRRRDRVPPPAEARGR
ncbi:hypothetical protein B0T10DRAFT_315074 [Thelonectria olida]|uniref:Uncharacterized protein n=1 Tax=Thelonectria olida TaxID=1576542 RepID=A0A9P9AQT7_9HYPO|nr:hypothetical protein B0T10DRAFT_315074 [Thelonectria olida]